MEIEQIFFSDTEKFVLSVPEGGGGKIYYFLLLEI